MCEKNFEGKQMSLFPNDENDDTIPSDWEKVKSSKKKKRSKRKKRPTYEYCNTCEQNITLLTKKDSLNHNDKYHRVMAKDYCKSHEITYSDHKCKPHWCGDCGFLIKYTVKISFDKTDYYN